MNKIKCWFGRHEWKRYGDLIPQLGGGDYAWFQCQRPDCYEIGLRPAEWPEKYQAKAERRNNPKDIEAVRRRYDITKR